MLAMLENGASGNTQAQMLTTMGFDADDEEGFNAYFNRLIKELPAHSHYTTLHIANSIWLDEGYPFYTEYLTRTANAYCAAMEELDFSDPKSADVINNWCNKNTKGKIKSIISASELSEDLRLAAVNAIYFKSDWADAFKTSNTYKQTFHAPNGDYQIPFMHEDASYSYFENEIFRMAQIPYKGQGFCANIIIPSDDNTIADVIDHLDAEMFTSALNDQYSQALNLALPKVELTCTFDLINIINDLGIIDATNPEIADFSRMSKSPLFLGIARQKTYLNIDEKGTTAAAVSMGGMMDAAAPEPFVPIPFVVDQPYIFIIREQYSNIILFVGVINKP